MVVLGAVFVVVFFSADNGDGSRSKPLSSQTANQSSKLSVFEREDAQRILAKVEVVNSIGKDCKIDVKVYWSSKRSKGLICMIEYQAYFEPTSEYSKGLGRIAKMVALGKKPLNSHDARRYVRLAEENKQIQRFFEEWKKSH